MLLSHGSIVYVHRTDDAMRPVCFAFATLAGWVTLASIHDPSTPRLREPRGINLAGRPGSLAKDTFAWAWANVSMLRCFNEYDKVALVQNLIRADARRRLTTLPDTDGWNPDEAMENVYKILNTLAILDRDYSILLTAHEPGNPMLSIPGSGWAGVPRCPDVVCESWNPRNYFADLDPDPEISADGMVLKGVTTVVVRENPGRFGGTRAVFVLTSMCSVTDVASMWLTNEALDREPSLGLLRDVLYAIEVFDARSVYHSFMPIDEHWTYTPPFIGDLKQDIMNSCNRITGLQRNMGQPLNSMQRDGRLHFS